MSATNNSTPDNTAKRAKEKAEADSAANLIRQKLDALYDEEPDAKAEEQEVREVVKHHSKHQKYMYELSNSGKSLAEIQTAWHDYYAGLSDSEKHQVWQEFYDANKQTSQLITTSQPKTERESGVRVHEFEAPKPGAAPAKRPRHTRTRPVSSVAEVKHQLTRRTPPKKQKLSKHQHIKSLLFGLGLGSLVVLILLFSFFNERFIAPFITPSKHVSATPIIIDPNSSNVGPDPKVIIPKINVEGPVVYDEPSIDDAPMQKALERGVVHYATTPYPGEKGNVVIFGHSSGNIFNRGKAKFAFVLLGWLDKGDLFYLTKGGKSYVYKVYKKQVVDPTSVAVLGTQDKPATATLITCDPPGTSWHRMIIVGEQISPVPSSNTASTASKSNNQPAVLPSNSITLWQRIKNWFTG